MVADYIEYMQQNWISVIIQIFNAPLYFYIFTIKDDLRFLKWSLLSCAFFGLGYWSVSAWTGVIFSLFSMSFLIVSYYYKKHNTYNLQKNVTFIAIAILIILLNFYFARNDLFVIGNYFPVMAILSSLIHAYIYICKSVNTSTSRWLFICSHTLLVVYEIVIKLPLFAMVDLCGLISNISDDYN